MFLCYLGALRLKSADVSRSSLVFQKLVRNALFGNMFGVLALHQSGRLSKASRPLYCLVALWVTNAQAHLKL